MEDRACLIWCGQTQFTPKQAQYTLPGMIPTTTAAHMAPMTAILARFLTAATSARTTALVLSLLRHLQPQQSQQQQVKFQFTRSE